MQGVCVCVCTLLLYGVCGLCVSVCMHLGLLARGSYEAHQVPLVILYTSRDVPYYVERKY